MRAGGMFGFAVSLFTYVFMINCSLETNQGFLLMKDGVVCTPQPSDDFESCLNLA